MPEDLPDIPHEEILRYEEIMRVCAASVNLGINNFRVTGGEPLVRRGCMDFLRMLKSMPGAGRVMITTNGVLLEQFLPELCAIGVDGINVSLDTLNRSVYQELTGSDAFDKVYRGVEAALAAGLRVKLNCVAMRGVNEDDFVNLASLTERYPLDVRFIESMPIGLGGGFNPVTGSELMDLLQKKYPGFVENHDRRGFGPAVYYRHARLKGQIGFISPISHGFCESCNRIRLTADGMLKTCLYFDYAIDLKPVLRGGSDEDTLIATIRDAVAQKQERHFFRDETQARERRNMSQIGG